MAGTAGWYVGLIDIGSVADIKAGTAQTQQATVFQWRNATTRPTVASANITGLASIIGGPYATQALAQAAANGKGTNGVPGTGKSTGSSTSTVNSANGSLPNPLSGLAAVGDFLVRLGDPNTWIRVAKIIIGGTLLIVGLAHMSGADNALASVARKVPVPV